MAEGAAVAAISGTLIAMEGERRASKAQQRAALANAEARRLEALELMDRFEINSQALVMEGEQVKGQQQVDIAGKGIDVGSSAALNIIEETNALVARQLIIDRKEALFKKAQLERGAAMDVQLASDIRDASRWRRAGMFLSGAGATASAANSRRRV